MRIIKRNIEIYTTSDNKNPFIEWLENLENKTRYRIKIRLDRILLGNLGDYKFVGSGVFELRLCFDSAYRIYFGMEANNAIVLLCGGDKATQSKDIKKAILYWQDYLMR